MAFECDGHSNFDREKLVANLTVGIKSACNDYFIRARCRRDSFKLCLVSSNLNDGTVVLWKSGENIWYTHAAGKHPAISKLIVSKIESISCKLVKMDELIALTLKVRSDLLPTTPQ